jgi:hypothetical protein
MKVVIFFACFDGCRRTVDPVGVTGFELMNYVFKPLKKGGRNPPPISRTLVRSGCGYTRCGMTNVG